MATDRRWLRPVPRPAWLLVSYALLAISGAMAAIGSSPVLLREGDHVITLAWAVCAITGAIVGTVGTLARRIVVELVGQTCGASASLTWSVALIMQAADTHSLAPLTGACLALTSVALIGQRWVEAAQAVRATGEE